MCPKNPNCAWQIEHEGECKTSRELFGAPISERTFMEMETEELDELVHEAKAGEASDINNQGRAAQISYLRREALFAEPS